MIDPYCSNTKCSRLHRGLAMLIVAAVVWILPPLNCQGADSLAAVIAEIQPKVVKIYGSGGLRGLEAYQSGVLVSSEGYVLTVWSYVLDAEDYIIVVLDDGQRFQAKLVNHDPRLEIALLKIDAKGVPFFDLDAGSTLPPGSRVLALSNLFGIATGNEPVSVQHGTIAAATQLQARRGAFSTRYRGRAYILDAMVNNPGAAGGALTDGSGRLVGLLGKELRSSTTNNWLNYAVPVSELAQSVQEMMAGRNPPLRDDATAKKAPNPHAVYTLGIVLVPDVLPKTPPYVDDVVAGTSAEKAGLRRDDLILFVNGRMVTSCQDVVDELQYIDQIDPVRLTVQRDLELKDLELKP